MTRPPTLHPPRAPRAGRAARGPGAAAAGPSRARRTSTPATPAAPVGPSAATGLDGAPRWVSGALAGVQGALLSLLVVVMPALAAYVVTSADPSNAEIGWPRSVAVGSSLWLLGHGGPLTADGVTITLVPLGITALAVFTAYASARRSAHPALSSWVAATVAHVVAVLVVAALLGEAGPFGAGPLAVLRLALGSTAVAAVGLGAGMLRRGRLRELTRPAWSRIPALVRTGTAGGLLLSAVVVGVAGLVASGWVISGRAAAGDVIEGLGVDTFGGLVLAVGQLAVAPNLVLWVLAWLAGPGFSVGAGTSYAPNEVVSGPLPALPLLGALPTPGSGGGLVTWVPVVVVLSGAVAGWWLHGRLVASRRRETPLALVVLALAAGTLTGAATLLAGGAAGPGRLEVVGGPALLVGATVAGLGLLGAALVALPADPVLRRASARGARRTWDRVRGRGVVDPAAATDRGTRGSPTADPGDQPGEPADQPGGRGDRR
ncbi:hypothetical protein J4G33_10615 [Actinotalea sp. BY-33]|uniref:Uncharacterized protein n=1 Tax=Actinotalea soli TaxID=2819234 RepID=A0A939LR20_9CELL|nr:DUF6350 family protein [Actinotalea soli]MBO1752253.1 hypothetical protein [Actinotalea soli]